MKEVLMYQVLFYSSQIFAIFHYFQDDYSKSCCFLILAFWMRNEIIQFKKDNEIIQFKKDKDKEENSKNEHHGFYDSEKITMKTIYISGKITGIESEAVRLFAVAQTELAIKGYNTVNPMHLRHDHDKKWTSYMKVCIKALCDCDGIYLLSNWKRSKGAWVEFLLAKILKIKRVK